MALRINQRINAVQPTPPWGGAFGSFRAGSTPGALLLFVVFLGVGGACANRAHPSARDEAAQLSRAIDELREAPNPEKADKLILLRKIACQQPAICGARDQCASAYAGHIRAREELDSVMQLKDPALQAAQLSAAEQSLSAALKQTKACADRQGELVREYGLHL